MSAHPLTITTLVIGADYRKSLVSCLQSKAEYAKKHGYTYIEGGEKTWDRKRPISWSKIPFFLDICKSLPEGALIWQSDADVYITNPELSFESHVLPLLLGPEISGGVFMSSHSSHTIYGGKMPPLSIYWRQLLPIEKR